MLDENHIKNLLETQQYILEELESLRHGDSNISFGARLADIVVSFIGSWTFIIIQSILLVVWITLNIIAYKLAWDPYPFILLNLMLSFQAAYASPLILMAGNRETQKDRRKAIDAYRSIAHIERVLDKLLDELGGKSEQQQE